MPCKIVPPVLDLRATVLARQIWRWDSHPACEGLVRALDMSRHAPLLRASLIARGTENRTDMLPKMLTVRRRR